MAITQASLAQELTAVDGTELLKRNTNHKATGNERSFKQECCNKDMASGSKHDNKI
jgi:hypothetical protein